VAKKAKFDLAFFQK